MAIVPQIRKRNQQFQARVTKRGQQPKDPENRLPVGPAVIALFVFVVVGSGKQEDIYLISSLYSQNYDCRYF